MRARLSTNSLWLLLSRLGTQLGLAVFTVLLARQLGSSTFGAYAFIASIGTIGNVLTTFGTDMLLIREIAATGKDGLLSTALLVQLALSLAFIAAVGVFASALETVSSEAVVAMRITSLSMVPLAFFTVSTISLRGRQRMLAYSLLNLALMLLQIACAGIVIWFRTGLVTLAILLVCVQVAAAALAARLAPVVGSGELKSLITFNAPKIRFLINAGAPIALLSLAGILYQRLTFLILPWVSGTASTGWYSAAARIVEAAKVGHVALFTAIYPMMSQARQASAVDFARGFRPLGWLLGAGSVVIASMLSLFAPWLCTVLFGAQYESSGPVLRILAWILVPYSASGLLSIAYLARGQPVCILRALGAATIVLAILTAWWLPVAGPAGAAYAALCAEAVQTLVLATQIRKLAEAGTGHPEYGFATPS
jgi:O-antigen/teichoic acid export membrane protein